MWVAGHGVEAAVHGQADHPRGVGALATDRMRYAQSPAKNFPTNRPAVILTIYCLHFLLVVFCLTNLSLSLYIYIYIYIHTWLYIYIPLSLYMYIYIYIYMYIYIYICIYTYMCVYIYIYIHMYT